MIRTIVLAAAAVALAGTAGAQTQLSAHLMGSNEKPTAGDPNGMGHATVKVDTAKNQVCYDLMVEKLGSAATMAHIHKAGPDAAGPVAVPLTSPANGKSSGCATVDPAVAKDIAANPGGYYVNVHTEQFKAGAIRGQLSK
jgi:hypothetical protein